MQTIWTPYAPTGRGNCCASSCATCWDLSSQRQTFAELSDVAEACLIVVIRLLASEQLTVIALGKLGGREISYGADLDVLFVGEDVRAAQNLMIAMAQPTAEGNIWALDARLRPEGKKAPVVCSLKTYES